MINIVTFINQVENGINQIEQGLDTLKTLGVKVLEGEFYLPTDIPEIYTERLEMLQEKLPL